MGLLGLFLSFRVSVLYYGTSHTLLNGVPNYGSGFFILIGCGLDLNIMSNDETEKLRDDQLYEDELDTLSLKTTLSTLNFCVNMLQVRKDATDSALKFIMPKVVNCKTPLNLCRETILLDGAQCDSAYDKMIFNSKFEPRFGRAESEVTSGILCSTHFDVDHFVNQDEDLGGYRPFDFSDILSANVFVENGNDLGW